MRTWFEKKWSNCRRWIARLLPAILLVMPASSSAQTSPARTEVIEFVRTYVEAQNNFDATSSMDMMMRSPDVTSAALGKITRGWESIRAGFDEALELSARPFVTLGVMDIELMGPSYALVVAPFVARVGTGRDASLNRGALTLVLTRSPEGWRVFHEHASYELEGLSLLLDLPGSAQEGVSQLRRE